MTYKEGVGSLNGTSSAVSLVTCDYRLCLRLGVGVRVYVCACACACACA